MIITASKHVQIQNFPGLKIRIIQILVFVEFWGKSFHSVVLFHRPHGGEIDLSL